MYDKAKEMAQLAIEALEDTKAEDIRVIDISDISTLADCFIIANGSNRSQVQALRDHVEEKLGRAGYLVKNVEGYEDVMRTILPEKIVFSIQSQLADTTEH